MAEPRLLPERDDAREASPGPPAAFAPSAAPPRPADGTATTRRRPWSGDILVRIAVLAAAGIVVALLTTQWDRWVGDATRQVTDDAYIRGDVTPLSAQVDGYVRHVAVNDFERVEKGQLLVEIDDADYKARVAQAEAALLGAEAAIENIKSRKAMQKAEVAAAEGAIAAANADVERTQDEAKRQRDLLATTFGTAQKVEQAIAAEKRAAAALVSD
jgi:membrane fusion protein (multidrug efflux system)